jgi:hypothetical protein
MQGRVIAASADSISRASRPDRVHADVAARRDQGSVEVRVSKTWFWTPKDTLGNAPSAIGALRRVGRAGHIEAVPGAHQVFLDRRRADELCAKYQPSRSAAISTARAAARGIARRHRPDAPRRRASAGLQSPRDRRADEEPKESGADEIALWMPDSINKLEAALLEKRITIDVNPVMRMCAQRRGLHAEPHRASDVRQGKGDATHRRHGVAGDEHRGGDDPASWLTDWASGGSSGSFGPSVSERTSMCCSAVHRSSRSARARSPGFRSRSTSARRTGAKRRRRIGSSRCFR